jgi:hypothetical protein
MKANPIFQFNTTSDTGIDKVPVGAKVLIIDSDGTGVPKEVLKKDLGPLDENSTIGDFLNNSSLFTEITGSIDEVDGGTY